MGDTLPASEHISRRGRVLLPVLISHWSPAESVRSVCTALSSLLAKAGRSKSRKDWPVEDENCREIREFLASTRGGRDQFFENEAIRGEFSVRNGKRYGIRGEFLARKGKQYNTRYIIFQRKPRNNREKNWKNRGKTLKSRKKQAKNQKLQEIQKQDLDKVPGNAENGNEFRNEFGNEFGN